MKNSKIYSRRSLLIFIAVPLVSIILSSLYNFYHPTLFTCSSSSYEEAQALFRSVTELQLGMENKRAEIMMELNNLNQLKADIVNQTHTVQGAATMETCNRAINRTTEYLSRLDQDLAFTSAQINAVGAYFRR